MKPPPLSTTFIQRNPAMPSPTQLLCRVYYAQDMAERRIRECELAVSNAPDSSEQPDLARPSLRIQGLHANPSPLSISQSRYACL
jgi:hypothetical protein